MRIRTPQALIISVVFLLASCFHSRTFEKSDDGSFTWHPPYLSTPAEGHSIELSYFYRHKIIDNQISYEVAFSLDQRESGIHPDNFISTTYSFAGAHDLVIEYLDADNFQLKLAIIPLRPHDLPEQLEKNANSFSAVGVIEMAQNISKKVRNVNVRLTNNQERDEFRNFTLDLK